MGAGAGSGFALLVADCLSELGWAAEGSSGVRGLAAGGREKRCGTAGMMRLMERRDCCLGAAAGTAVLVAMLRSARRQAAGRGSKIIAHRIRSQLSWSSAEEGRRGAWLIKCGVKVSLAQSSTLMRHEGPPSPDLGRPLTFYAIPSTLLLSRSCAGQI